MTDHARMLKTVGRYELALTQVEEKPYDKDIPILVHPVEVVNLIRSFHSPYPFEEMGALYFDQTGRPIAHSVVYRGTLNRIKVEPRGLLAVAILRNATSFILRHTHPSDCVDPSTEDLAFTERLADASRIVGVRLKDHLILGVSSWESLKRRGVWS